MTPRDKERETAFCSIGIGGPEDLERCRKVRLLLVGRAPARTTYSTIIIVLSTVFHPTGILVHILWRL
jgi:hypothetical protein